MWCAAESERVQRAAAAVAAAIAAAAPPVGVFAPMKGHSAVFAVEFVL